MSIGNNLKHDEVFRKALSNPIIAREFLDTYLPANIKAIIGTTNLRLEQETFIEENLRKTMCDVLFSSTDKEGNKGYVYILLEHQSKPHPFMAYRLHKYKMGVYQHHLDNNPKANKLPLIYPLVFYNGREVYNASRNIWDITEYPDIAKEIWQSDHGLIAVQNIDDDELSKQQVAGVFQLLMKHVWKRNILSLLKSLNLKIIAIIDGGKEQIIAYISYILPKSQEEDKIELKKILKEKLGTEGEKIMGSLVQSWIDEGSKKEKEEITINMLKEGDSNEKIQRITGLTLQEITKLKKYL